MIRASVACSEKGSDLKGEAQTQPPPVTENVSSPTPSKPVPAGVQARVVRVIDGDTIQVDPALHGIQPVALALAAEHQGYLGACVLNGSS